MHTESAQTLDINDYNARASTRRAATPDGAISSIAREFQKFVADIEDLIQSTTSLSGDDLARAKSKLHARVAAAKDSIQESSASLVDRARSAVKGTDSYVHDQPWLSVGIAAGVGLLTGYLLGRRA